MGNLRWICALVGLAFLAACSQGQSTNGAAATLAPSPAASPSSAAAGAVVVGLSGVQANITLVRAADGSVVASIAGRPVDDEHAIGAYLIAAGDGSGKEWTVDRSGVVKEVAPTATKLLAPGAGSPLVLNSTTAIIGCDRSPNGSCVAQAVDLTTGAVRALLTVASTSPVMRYGESLKVLDASADLNTVWLREVSGATPKLTLVAIDLSAGNVTSHDLPAALADEQDLAISRDGKWVAGQESAGTDSNNLAIRHLHVFSLATGVDTDVQGSAAYVGGLRTPSVLFAPDSSRVAWWGGVNNGDSPQRMNVSMVAGTGKTVYPTDVSGDVNGINGLFWLSGSTLVVVHGGMFTVNADTGASAPLQGGIDSLLGVLLPAA